MMTFFRFAAVRHYAFDNRIFPQAIQSWTPQLAKVCPLLHLRQNDPTTFFADAIQRLNNPLEVSIMETWQGQLDMSKMPIALL
jgi:hypothetical protein